MAEYLLGGRAVRVDLGVVSLRMERLSRSGMTRAAVAAECDVSDRTLRRFLIGRRVSASTMNKILSGLALDAADVIQYLPGGTDGNQN